jgi:hypothetical protein
MYCSPGAVNLKAYGSQILQAVQELGPGEKSVNQDIVPRGSRKPPPDIGYPVALSSLTLASVTNEHDEILSANFVARYATGTNVNLIRPSLPPTTADPPNILVLKNLAFRRLI